MIVYKNDYIENERLFSTGDTELDDILEEVYYSGLEDGYDYAQREFSNRKSKAASMALREVANLPSSRSNRVLKKEQREKLVKELKKLSDKDLTDLMIKRSESEREKILKEMSGTSSEALHKRISAKGNDWSTKISKRTVNRASSRGLNHMRWIKDHPEASSVDSPQIINRLRNK